MANPSWPNTLPGPVLDSLSHKPLENQIRSQMEAGLAKVRRRFTAVGADVGMVVVLTEEQVELLEDFVATQLKDVLPFDWQDFRRPNAPGNAATYRFKSRPAYTPWGEDHWQASLDLEQLP